MQRIFITGVTGFIGGRLAEMACKRNLTITGLVRNWSRAVRLARLPAQIIYGDILDLDSLRMGMQDCDIVFHCAVDNRVGGKTHHHSSVQGTANVMQAARETGVKRVVHLSSVGVYSYKPRQDIATEEGTYRYSKDVYCNGKIDAEKVALNFNRKHGLPITVLRPTIVYGPFGDYTVETVDLIRLGRMVLVDHGKGICNSLYVDNLVEAMLLAAECKEADGQIFHISDANSITWKEFIMRHAQALGSSYLSFPKMTVQEIEIASARMSKSNLSILMEQMIRYLRDPKTSNALYSIPGFAHLIKVARFMSRVLVSTTTRSSLKQRTAPTNGTLSNKSQSEISQSLPLSKSEVDMFSIFGDVTFSIDKARKILGYNPKINFTEGMDRTAAWIKWARL